MATAITTKKGHKIIELTPREAINELNFGIGDMLIDDMTGDDITNDEHVYFISVLNQLVSKSSFVNWNIRCTYYEEDTDYENKVFEQAFNQLSDVKIQK